MTACPAQPPPLTKARTRHRVLVSAYALSPYRGSEPGIGWNVVSRLAAAHDITVLASPNVPGSYDNNFKEDFTRFTTDNGPIPGLTVHWITAPLLSHLFQRESLLCRRTLYYTGYAAWQRKAAAVGRQLHNENPFDLIHHLNITGFREPGYLWKLPVPFVWGPIAGAAGMPPRYFDLLSRRERLFYKLRNFSNARHKRNRRCRAAAAAAKHIWAVSPEDQAMAKQQWGADAEQLRESAATPRPDGSIRTYNARRPLRIVWSGQFIGRKALPILLHALAQLRVAAGHVPTVELTVLGDGPEQQHWLNLALQLQLNDIKWIGWVPRDQALRYVDKADVLVSTSLLEGTPQVLLEALALGVPVICHDTCGMSLAINDTCGIRIPLTDSLTSIAAYTTALRRLAENPALLQRLSAGALQRVIDLSWDNQVARMLQVYEQILTAPCSRELARVVAPQPA